MLSAMMRETCVAVSYRAMATAPTSRLTLFYHLSNLSFNQAAKLLGPDGNALILRVGTYKADAQERVGLTQETFRLDLYDSTVSISLDDAARDRLRWECSSTIRARSTRRRRIDAHASKITGRTEGSCPQFVHIPFIARRLQISFGTNGTSPSAVSGGPRHGCAATPSA